MWKSGRECRTRLDAPPAIARSAPVVFQARPCGASSPARQPWSMRCAAPAFRRRPRAMRGVICATPLIIRALDLLKARGVPVVFVHLPGRGPAARAPLRVSLSGSPT